MIQPICPYQCLILINLWEEYRDVATHCQLLHVNSVIDCNMIHRSKHILEVVLMASKSIPDTWAIYCTAPVAEGVAWPAWC